jgi:hypothetical protein
LVARNHRSVVPSAFALACAFVCLSGCGGASKTVVVTRTVDASSTAAARAAAAAQIAAATQGASKAGQASTATSSAAPTATAGSAAPGASGQKALSGVLAEADAICVRRHGELSALAVKGSGQQASAHRAAIEQRALAELSALHPPAKVARAYRQMLDSSRIALSGASKAGGQGQFRLLVAAVRAGVKHCATVD